MSLFFSMHSCVEILALDLWRIVLSERNLHINPESAIIKFLLNFEQSRNCSISGTNGKREREREREGTRGKERERQENREQDRKIERKTGKERERQKKGEKYRKREGKSGKKGKEREGQKKRGKDRKKRERQEKRGKEMERGEKREKGRKEKSERERDQNIFFKYRHILDWKFKESEKPVTLRLEWLCKSHAIARI